MDEVNSEINKNDTPEWQWSYESWENKLFYLYDCKHLSDVTFMVGENCEEISAHKLILTCSSSVFEAMFYGGLPEGHKVNLPGDEPSAFKLLLKHIYGEITIESVMQAMQLFAIAHKYRIKNIMDCAIEFIDNNLNDKDVLKVLQFSKLYDEESLIKTSLEEWTENASNILQSETFLDIEVALIEELFAMEKLNIKSEAELVEVFGKYADKHKDDDEFKNYDKSKILSKIRLLSIEPKDMAKCTVLKSLISESDYCKILENMFLNFGDMPKYICENRMSRGAQVYNFRLNCSEDKYKRMNYQRNYNITMKLMFYQNSEIVGFHFNYPETIESISIELQDVGPLEHSLINKKDICTVILKSSLFVEKYNWKVFTIKYLCSGCKVHHTVSKITSSEDLILVFYEEYYTTFRFILYKK